MTPEQEDSILQALRPLCPNQSPEQLRAIIKQTIPMMAAQSEGLEEELLSRFPNLGDLLKGSP